MAYGRISKKQQEILDYIKNEILNRGFPPAVREICEAVNLKSTSSVHSHLEALEKNGYIRRDATKPRAIEIIDDNFNLVRREVVNVPLVGTVAAGQPMLAVENIEGYFPVPAEYMPNAQSFMLKVKGDSMIRMIQWNRFLYMIISKFLVKYLVFFVYTNKKQEYIRLFSDILLFFAIYGLHIFFTVNLFQKF